MSFIVHLFVYCPLSGSGREALKRKKKNGKAAGAHDIPVEVWKCEGEGAVEFLTELFNMILRILRRQ